MRKYKLSKVIISSVIIFVFLVIHWIFCNIPIILKSGSVDRLNLFVSLLCDNGGYEYRQSMMVIYIIPFLLGISYITSYDFSIFNIVRTKSKNRIFNQYLINIITWSFLFSFFHEIINIVGMNCVFSNSVIDNNKFILSSLINLFAMTIFYARVGMIYWIYKILASEKISLLLTLVTYCICYYFMFLFPVLGEIGLPCYDCSLIGGMITDSFTLEIILIKFFKGIMLLIGILILCLYLWKDKDIFEDERK
ncbi:MAG: WxPxxD family membrane protein [Oscillospiraceae bacterium]|nr:WxPxxD family membrane protein [Oscillospiraceae bacterium]